MQDQREQIKGARHHVYIPDGRFGLLLAATIITGIISTTAGVVFAVLVAMELLARIRRAAHLLCPRCGEPFGSKRRFPIGLGKNTCQNCGLGLEE